MAVLPPTHEERLAALSVSDELRAVTIDRDRILEGVGGDEALVDAMLECARLLQGVLSACERAAAAAAAAGTSAAAWKSRPAPTPQQPEA